MKSDSLFLIMILGLTSATLVVSGEAKSFLNDSVVYSHQIEDLQREQKESELRQALLQERLFDYQQSVAQTLNEDLNPKTLDELNLLVPSRVPASLPDFDRSEMILARAKDQFNSNQFKKAADSFRELIEKYPASPKSVEARFLRAESLYLSSQLDLCVDEIETMMTQFPDHPMTGFLMLRLSQILKGRSRNPEAIEVLKMIERSFPGEKLLLEQARVLETEYRIL